jgi:hypothetical protein
VNGVVGGLLPLAAGVAVSPIPIIAVILMLGTPRAKVNGPAFALGWVLGLCVVSAVVLLLAGSSPGGEDTTSTIAAVARLAFGALFFLLAVKQWRGRPTGDAEVAPPAWTAAFDSFSVPRSLAVGALLSGANPKNLALTAAAAASVAEAGLTTGQSTAALGVFVLVGSLTVAGPVLASLLLGAKATGPLAAVKEFLVAHSPAIMMVLFVILGANLVGAGYAGLTA